MFRTLQDEYERFSARERPGRPPRVTTVRVVVGGLHQLVEESFRMAFEALTAETPFAGAVLLIEKRGVSASCPACGWEGPITVPFFLCGRCGQGGLSTTSGNEFFLKDMEIADDEPENL